MSYRRLSSPQVRTLIEHVVRGVEGYGHAGNAAAKTEELAAFFVRLCRGQRRMDGRLLTRVGEPVDPEDLKPHWIKLPGLLDGEPWRHWVLVQSYAQAKDSSMRAYLKMLGDWPHDVGWANRALGHVKIIKVKPEVEGWSDEPETWSEITFISQENMTDEDVRYVQGARVHSVHADEMPQHGVWGEVRARRIANRKLLKVITATPEFKHEWQPFWEDFRACANVVVRGRIRVQWSVDDNRALSREDIELRKQDYLQGDGTKGPLYEARVRGDHCDVSASCPFPYEPMDRMLKTCAPGRLDTYIVREASEAAPDVLEARAFVERWVEYNRRHRYLIVADTSRGIDDGKHDPSELQVWDWTEPMLAARYGMRSGVGGYLDEDALALLADMLGREYGDALQDWEVTGGYGVQYGATLRRLNYPNLSRDDKTLSPGVLAPSFGWVASATTNGEIVNALVNGLNGGTFKCWSADAVQQWRDVRMAKDGTTPGVKRNARHHREAMICAGRALHVIQTKAAVPIMEKQADPGMEAALRRDFGRRIELPSRAGRRGRGLTEIFRPEMP